MPPWPAAKGFGEFLNDISLPQEEINRLAEWAEGGAPEGEQQYLPPPAKVPLWRATAPPAGKRVRIEGTLGGAITILAVRATRSGRVKGKAWAEFPGGRVIPLVWFTGEGKQQWLIYREPVHMPAGTGVRGVPLDAIVR